jgi:hypothetical protein
LKKSKAGIIDADDRDAVREVRFVDLGPHDEERCTFMPRK